MVAKLRAYSESWPLARPFAISRGVKREAVVVVAELKAGGQIARGECVPYARYGESVEETVAAIAGFADEIAGGAGRKELQLLLPAGAARNALDCAFWDLEAKQRGRRAWQIARLAEPDAMVTAYTISLDTPHAMAEDARRASHRPLLKIKLGGGNAEEDSERLAAVRATAPTARLIVDANEAWRGDDLEKLLTSCARAHVEMVEQPLPAGHDAALREIDRPVPVYADESLHNRQDLPQLAGCYDGINIKLDKTGGLTEAIALANAARAEGLGVMVGCMVATSLAMAPAMMIASRASYVDLDGPLLLARDRDPGLLYEESLVHPPDAALWG